MMQVVIQQLDTCAVQELYDELLSMNKSAKGLLNMSPQPNDQRRMMM